MLGFTINRVTLFALILSLGLLVDDPIVDVENIARHFALRKKATRRIVLEAVAEIRPPLITATLAVIVSFLPMFFITGMMGPYMRPMALNVPVTMLMSMVVAFTITPWLAYHVLRRKYSADRVRFRFSRVSPRRSAGSQNVMRTERSVTPHPIPLPHDPHDLDAVKQSRLYKVFYPLMAPLLHSRLVAWAFLIGMVLLDRRGDGAGGHAQRAAEDAAVRQQERTAAGAGFRRRHDPGALRRGRARLRGLLGRRARGRRLHQLRRAGLARWTSTGWCATTISARATTWRSCGSTWRARRTAELQSHAIGLRMRNDLQAIADRHHARMKLVETPPGPPVIASVVAEVYGQPDQPLRRPSPGRRHRAGAPGGGAGRGRCR